jgi:hypothetical protein
MPWLETSPVEQRERFIRDHRLDLYAMASVTYVPGLYRVAPRRAEEPRIEGGARRETVGPGAG